MHHESGFTAVDLQIDAIIQTLHPGPLFRMQRIQQTQKSTVVRCWDLRAASGTRSVIVKLIHDIEQGKRLLRLEQSVVSQLPVKAPAILGAGESGLSYWIVYEDVVQSSTRWTKRRFHQSFRTLAHLHQTEADTENFGDTFVSHTPHFREVFSRLQQHTEDDDRNMLADLKLNSRVKAEILELRAQSTEWLSHLDDVPDVLCHGDFHKGNVLYPGGTSEPYVIDWEFVHYDSMYFDLFQYLDATSPTQSLLWAGSRLEGLNTYWAAMSQRRVPNVSRETWIRGYLEYAALHLMWILTLIHADISTGSYSQTELRRQTGETVEGIVSIRSQMEQVGPD